MNMEALHVPSSEDTPAVILDAAAGRFEVSKRSLPEDAATFYAPVLEWMMNYANHPNEQTEFVFNLEYFNTSSAKQLFKLLNILEQISKRKKAWVLWRYDKGDQDMLASGERYSRLTELKFKMEENPE
jgi:hypothetical protein